MHLAILFFACVVRASSSPPPSSPANFVAHARLGTQGRLGNQMFQWAALLHASSICQLEPAISWNSLRSQGPRLAQGGAGHGLHLHAVFDLPPVRIAQLRAEARAIAPDNATSWQPEVFDCSRNPLLLSGYFQHVKYIRPVASELLHHFVFLESDACSAAMRALRSATDFPFVISVHVRRGDNVRVHNGPSITRATHPAYIMRAVKRVLHRVSNIHSDVPSIALLFSDSKVDLAWCASNINLHIPSVVPVYISDEFNPVSNLVGFNITGCGDLVAPRWCEVGKILPSNLELTVHSRSVHLEGEGVDLCLMSACDSWVLSPSTYGWWGAWLGAQRLVNAQHSVVLPHPWFNAAHATTGSLDGSGLLWDHRWEWLELDDSRDSIQNSNFDSAIEFREPLSGWLWTLSNGPFIFRFYVWSAHGGGVNLFIDDVLIGGPYPPFQDIKLEIPSSFAHPGLLEFTVEREDGSSFASIVVQVTL